MSTHSVITSLNILSLPQFRNPIVIYSTIGGCIGQISLIPSLEQAQRSLRLQQRIYNWQERQPTNDYHIPTTVGTYTIWI